MRLNFKWLGKMSKAGWLKTFFALILLFASIAFVYWPILIGRLSFRGDGVGFIQLFFSYGIKYFVADQGVLPNWWAQFNSGYPINLTLNGFLNPLFLLVFKYLPVIAAFHWLNIILLFLGGVSLYFLARNLSMSRLAALVSALTFCFSGIIVKYVELTVFSTIYPIIPLLFLALLKIFEGRKIWYLPLFLINVYIFIGGFAELYIYILFCSVFFFIFLCFHRKLNWKAVARKILGFGLVFLSVFLILLPWLLPVFYFIGLSPRADSLDTSGNNYGAGIGHLIQMINPHIEVFYGQLLPIQVGLMSYDLFVGAMSLLLVLVGIFFGGFKNVYAKFFGGLGLFTFLVSVESSPIYWLIHKLPLMEKFRWQFKWSFITVFALALLAGFGADALKKFWQSRRKTFLLVPVWSFLILFFAAGLFLTVYDQEIKDKLIQYGSARYSSASDHVLSRPPDYYQFIVSRMAGSLVDEFSFKNDKLPLMLVLWFVSAGILTFGGYFLSKIHYQKLRALILIAVILGLTLPWLGKVTGPEIRYFELPETAKFLHSINKYSPAGLPLFQNQEPLAPYRLFVYTPDQYFSELTDKYREINFQDYQNQHWFRRELIANNWSVLYGFDKVFNGEPLVSYRWTKVKSFARRQPYFKDIKFQDTPFSQFLSEFSATSSWKFLGMLNIKYVTSIFELPQRGKPIFTSRVLDDKLPIYVYENPFFQPRWYFAEKIKWTTAQGDDAVFEEFSKIEDFQKITLLEALSSNDLALAGAGVSVKDKIDLGKYANGYLKLNTSAKGYRWLVFSETMEPFWQAKINSQPVPLYTANYVYQAVLVPPGENVVEFYYPGLWQQSFLAFPKLFLGSK